MRKAGLDQVFGIRPFRPVEIRLVDGRRFRFTSPQQVVIGNSAVLTLDRKGDTEIISRILIVSARTGNGHGRRSSRRR